MKPYLFAALIVLQLLDVATTLYGIKRRAVESMYFMKNLIAWFDDAETALVLSKSAFVILLCVFYSDIHWLAFLALNVFYLRIAANNVKVIKRLG